MKRKNAIKMFRWIVKAKATTTDITAQIYWINNIKLSRVSYIASVSYDTCAFLQF